jgi:hypothetical protein
VQCKWIVRKLNSCAKLFLDRSRARTLKQIERRALRSCCSGLSRETHRAAESSSSISESDVYTGSSSDDSAAVAAAATAPEATRWLPAEGGARGRDCTAEWLRLRLGEVSNPSSYPSAAGAGAAVAAGPRDAADAVLERRGALLAPCAEALLLVDCSAPWSMGVAPPRYPRAPPVRTERYSVAGLR